MIDMTILENMVSYAGVDETDVVLEVGAGLGFLTRLLAEKCRKVVAVEIDSKLVKVLEDEFRSFGNVDLLHGNIFKISAPNFNKVVSTPPYHVSSSLIFWLLGHKFDCAVLAFQKEFAERLIAPLGSKDYGRLAVVAYFWAEVELLDFVPKELFYPQPEIGSLVVRLKPRETPPFLVKDAKLFHELVQTLFSQRNKKVRNAILPFLHKLGKEKTEVTRIADSLPFHDRRVRELTPEDFGAIANELAN